MGRNDIRLRRHMMSAGKIQGYRNYAALMQQHERGLKLKRITRVFIYFLIIAFFVIILFIISRWEDKHQPVKTKPHHTTYTGRDLHLFC